MAVVTPDGIVGKIIAAYPTASQVLLVTDPDFAAGVVSQKNKVHGTMKGTGTPTCRVDYVPLEEKIEVGERVFTSGDDRVFPRGFPVGVVKSVHDAQPFKEILVEPSGTDRGLEDVLIILNGVHEEIPQLPAVNGPGTNGPVYVAPAPPAPAAAAPAATGPANLDATNPDATRPDPTKPGAIKPAAPGELGQPRTEADRVRDKYKAIGDSQHHVFGDPNAPSAPNFNAGLPASALKPGAAPAQPPKAGSPAPESPSDAARRKNQVNGGPGGGQQ
jgi:rod shape-determining protein MreC